MMTTILLIEDASDLAKSIQRELETEGYQVIHAGDGLAGLEYFERKSPDLIILDWMLPKLDGLDVLREIRSRSPVPVLMLTARTEELDRVIGLEVGADDYLTKPFSMRELIARIHALLRRIDYFKKINEIDRSQHTGSITYEGLYINPESFETSLNGKNINLTRTEFDLLVLFLQNPGRVFSRAYLLDTIWGGNYIPGDRSVDNAILRLRKKLEDLGDAIDTVWGVGYRLKAKP